MTEAAIASVERPHLAKWKIVATWSLFLMLHFSYETFPGTFFRIFGEAGEVTFLHMKMLFWAYLAVSLVEFVVRRGGLASPASFISSRLLIAVAYPWLTITFWFAAEALGLYPTALLPELVYANVVTIVGLYLAMRLEESLDGVVFRPSLRALIVLLFACAVLSYVSFSFKTPMPFFVTPG